MNISIKHKIFIKLIIILFLFLVFTYVFYFSLINIINYWTYSEIHINYSLGFVKRGLLGSTMLYLESIGLSKNIFFASIFYLITCCNILLFLKLINKFYKKNILLYIFFALNPSLLLFSFYDLGGYARTEIFGISVCLLHAIFSQKFYNNEINYQKYLKLSFIIIYPTSLITILIHELNILFLSFHFFTTITIINKNNFMKIKNFKYLIFLNIGCAATIVYLLLTHPFTKETAIELYNNLQNTDGTSFWIWESIALSFAERISSQIIFMSGSIVLYFFIFLFYSLPIFFLLRKTLKQNKFQLIYAIASIAPFFFLFFIGIDWGRWIHIIIFVIFSYLIQFKEKKIKIINNYKNKFYFFIFILFILFQFLFTRLPHCCNLSKLNLDIFGGIIPKMEVFYKILNKNYDIKKRFKEY
jgi:hypothetical protein